MGAPELLATGIEWNDQGRPTRITDALGHDHEYEYDQTNAFMTASVDPLNRRTTFQYDAQGNLVQTTDAAGQVWRQTFDGSGDLRARTDPDGRSMSVGYDQTGDLTARTDGEQHTTTYDFDPRHRLTSRTDAKGRMTRYGYDDRDRRTQTTFADGALTLVVFDDDNRLVESTDALNRTTRTEYARTDRVSAVTDPAGGRTSYTYDVRGNLLTVTDANGHVTLYDYDALNRLKKITDPIGKTHRYGYDPEGNRIEHVDGNGVRTTFTFDALNRLVSRNLPNNQTEEFEYDAAGQLVRATNSSADIRYVHDAKGRVTEHRYANLGKAFQHEYDASGNRTLLRYPDDSTMTYAYDGNDRQVQATDSVAGMFRLAYDETGMRTSLAYPNGLTTHYSYDQRDRMLSIITDGEKGNGPGAQAPDFRYVYDLAGNRVSMDRSDDGLNLYEYDAKDQLTKATFPDGGYQQFSYDPVGNRLQLEERERGNGPIHTSLYSYDAADEMLSVTRDWVDPGTPGPGLADTPNLPSRNLFAGPGAMPNTWTTTYSYDGNGARTAKTPPNGPATAYSWDAQERLLEVAEGGRALEGNTYDAFARRSSITANGATTKILADETRSINAALFEYADHGTATRRLWVAGELRGRVEGKNPTFYSEDALGSVVSRASAGGEISGQVVYKPFGESTGRSASKAASEESAYLGGVGVKEDQAAGLLQMWRRHYDSSSGVFLSVDPLFLSLQVVRHRERYWYAMNEPTVLRDPTGLEPDYSACAAEMASCMSSGTNLAIATGIVTATGLALLTCANPAAAALGSNLAGYWAGQGGVLVLYAYCTARMAVCVKNTPE